jgi:TrmH family RNA methyltransferase
MLAIEGLRLVQEVLNTDLSIHKVFYTETVASGASGRSVVEACAARAIACWEVSADVMDAMSDTETPQGILIVMPIPDLRCRADDPFTLIPDSVRDPGNLGTILRTAWAAGVSQVLLPPGTVDYLNPKVVRAGMGAHLHMPMQQASWDKIRSIVGNADVWLAEANRGTRYDAVDWRGRVTLVVGGEAEGASDEGRALAGDRCVYIPMAANVDSLNAAMAAVVLLFEAAKQRHVDGHSSV